MFKNLFSLLIIILLAIAFHSISYAAQPLFGPKQYDRTTGKPDVYKDTFEACNTGATYTLVVENGEGGKSRISSASVTLNGTEVVAESELNQKVDRVEKTVTLKSENTIDAKVASGPGGFLKVSIYCTANCLGVKVTSPADKDTINRSNTIVKGSLSNTYGDVGVVVKSSGAAGEATALTQVQGNDFAGIAPLQTGANTITVTATDACGYQAEDSITINTASAEEPVRLTVLPSSGIPSSTTGYLEVTLEADANITNPVADYSWDLNGDGTPEMQGKDQSKVTGKYTYTGLYFPKVTITDTFGNKYTETAVVSILSKEEMDTLLKGKWDGMKGGLMSADADKALRYFSEKSKEKYTEIFNLLSKDIASLASNMQEIQFLYIKDNTAKYRIRREQNINGQQVIVTYYIYFTKDENGIWKIVSF